MVIDENEAIEIEALFYNYGSDTSIPGDGSAWMMEEADYWVTNLPNAYLDTRFMDSDNEKSYAIIQKILKQIIVIKYNSVIWVLEEELLVFGQSIIREDIIMIILIFYIEFIEEMAMNGLYLMKSMKVQ